MHRDEECHLDLDVCHTPDIAEYMEIAEYMGWRMPEPEFTALTVCKIRHTPRLLNRDHILDGPLDRTLKSFRCD